MAGTIPKKNLKEREAWGNTDAVKILKERKGIPISRGKVEGRDLTGSGFTECPGCGDVWVEPQWPNGRCPKPDCQWVCPHCEEFQVRPTDDYICYGCRYG